MEEQPDPTPFFIDESSIETPISSRSIQNVLNLAGSWSDLDWDDMERFFMPRRTYTVSEISDEIMNLLERFEQEPGVVDVTQNDVPVMVIMPYGLYKFLNEMLDTLRNAKSANN